MQLRVFEQISNGSIILTIDCDMCTNNVESIRDALCFFIDEERGHEYAFVQFPNSFENLTKQDLYASSFKMIHKVGSYNCKTLRSSYFNMKEEKNHHTHFYAQFIYFPGLDGLGGPMYTGSCCFHRRDCLNGRKYGELNKIELKRERPKIQEAKMSALEERTKNLATCSYEENTQWGKERLEISIFQSKKRTFPWSFSNNTLSGTSYFLLYHVHMQVSSLWFMPFAFAKNFLRVQYAFTKISELSLENIIYEKASFETAFNQSSFAAIESSKKTIPSEVIIDIVRNSFVH
ncbi:hypothetical protein IEQ34_008750 [Dendrobium chrysotoxum]|uniref:Uncharacterized protein n=1 Tax=Dendrobium chrysotoxum TaxID=161865 RepID=A0AAV7GHB0_DENCH|nr:hypothetical protein IEQ34_008750 [Dendrobium chrysotoxum]